MLYNLFCKPPNEGSLLNYLITSFIFLISHLEISIFANAKGARMPVTNVRLISEPEVFAGSEIPSNAVFLLDY